MKKSDLQLAGLLLLTFLFFGSFSHNPLSITTAIIGAATLYLLGSFYKEVNKP